MTDLNRRDFLKTTAAVFVVAALPNVAEAAPPTVVQFNPTVDQMKAAAKGTATGEATSAGTAAATNAAEGAATNEVSRRFGALGGLARRGLDKAKEVGSNAASKLTNETGKGTQILLTQAIKDNLAKGPVVVLFGLEEQGASLKTALDASAKPVVLIVADGTKGKELGEALAAITEPHKALGSPIAQFFKSDATKPDATMNAFQVNADTVKNILGGTAPAASPAAPATTPPAEQPAGNTRRRQTGAVQPTSNPEAGLG